MRFIDPVSEFGASLLDVEKPSRYVGGEFGKLAKKNAALQTAIAFPDLYEIGMSNQAMRIIYNGLNRLPDISCDRAFAPAPDFEKLLLEKKLPLYGLDTGISLKSLDLLLFTLGYELGLSGVLSMLELSGIPLHCRDRLDNDPVVVAGGPVVSNPLPYSPFIDAFWLGEAEAGFFNLAAELSELKKSGQGRGALLDTLAAHPNVWVKGKEKAVRAIDWNFSHREGEGATLPTEAVFPIPSMKIVQHHGALEIMRGCPNGCRFCHAGFWYRPQREKQFGRIIAEADTLVNRGGWHEISLSSLSSGDFSQVGNLVDALNERFASQHVSFQMPSLKISTFALSLLEKISQTRKSGLTFAVETPVDFWQIAINKQVARESVVEIIREAKRHNWRGAKFYFMIGLPLKTPPGSSPPDAAPLAEETEIVNFIADVARKTFMHFNINVGIFVPKPHTPFQWAAQIDSTAASAKLDYIKSNLKKLGHKVSVSDPLVSMIEGVLSRGDERAGTLAEEAWRNGSRLDAWSDYINREAWLAVLEKNRTLVNEFLMGKNPSAPLPWDSIYSGTSTAYLRREAEKAEYTPACTEDCIERCGVCGGKNSAVARNSPAQQQLPTAVNHEKNMVNSDSADNDISETISVNNEKTLVNNNDKKTANNSDPTIRRVLFSFCKEGSAVFHGHLSLIEIFSMAFLRAGLPVLYTQGFNPLAKIEFAAPLSTGISASAEIAAADFPVLDGGCSETDDPLMQFAAKLNANLPDGISIGQSEIFTIPAGCKKHSLASLLWGFSYCGNNNEPVYVPATGEKQFRQERLNGGSVFLLRRETALAKNANDAPAQPWVSYFDAYRSLYG